MEHKPIYTTTEIIVLIITCLSLGLLVGAVITSANYRAFAVKHNAAYYNPTNQEFTWRTNTPVKIQF